MHDAVRHVLHIPVHRLRAGDFDLILQVEQVRLDAHAAGIEVRDVIGAEAVAIVLRLERRGGQGPHAIGSLRHRLRVCTFEVEQHRLRRPGQGSER